MLVMDRKYACQKGSAPDSQETDDSNQSAIDCSDHVKRTWFSNGRPQSPERARFVQVDSFRVARQPSAIHKKELFTDLSTAG